MLLGCNAMKGRESAGWIREKGSWDRLRDGIIFLFVNFDFIYALMRWYGERGSYLVDLQYVFIGNFLSEHVCLYGLEEVL